MIKVLFLILFQFKVLAGADFDNLYMFTEDMREVILKTPGGHPMPNREFKLSTKQSDQMKALAELDDEIRTQAEVRKSFHDCDKDAANSLIGKRIKERDFNLQSVLIANSAKFESQYLGRFKDDDYTNAMNSFYAKGNWNAGSIYTPLSLEAMYKWKNPEVNLETMPFLQKVKTMSDFAEEWLGEKLPEGMMIKEYTYLTMIDRPKDWQKILLEAKDKLTNQQKIELVSRLGGVFSDRYNYDRRNLGLKARGEFVDTQQLLQSAKDWSAGGICRDIALAQVQFLETLGFKNNYVVTYKNLGSWHSNVVSTDPANGKIVKFNYSEVAEMPKGSTSEALLQDNNLPDFGLNYYVYDTNGKPVTKVSSELSLILKDTSGADLSRNFTPRNYSLTKVGFGGDGVDGNLFFGSTSAGDKIYGIAVFSNYAPNDNLKLSGGVSASHIEGNRTLVKVSQNNIYARASAELSSPKLKIGDSKTEAFIGAAGDIMLSNNREVDKDGKFDVTAKGEFDATLDYYLGAKNTTKFNDGKTELENKVTVNFYPDWNHVASGEKVISHRDSVIVKSGLTHQFDESSRGMIESAIILKNYGNSIVVKGSYEDEKRGMNYSAGVAAPITQGMPTFLPGGERRVFASVEKKTKNVLFTIEYERNIDKKSNSLMVKGKVNF